MPPIGPMGLLEALAVISRPSLVHHVLPRRDMQEASAQMVTALLRRSLTASWTFARNGQPP